jgi:hypothetical protein
MSHQVPEPGALLATAELVPAPDHAPISQLALHELPVQHVITAADPLPEDLRQALDAINRAS